MVKRTASLAPQHAETVCIIHHQPGIITLGQPNQGLQGRQIAIHAEHRIRQDQFAFRIAGHQHFFQLFHIVMGITTMLRTGKLDGID